MKFMLEIKRDIFSGKEERKFFTKDDVKNYNFNSFEEIDNSSVKTFLKELNFIKVGKTKCKIVDNEEIFISGIEIDDSVLEESSVFINAMNKLDLFESRQGQL